MHPSPISPNNKLYKGTPLKDNTPRVKPYIQNHNLPIAETPLTAPIQIKVGNFKIAHLSGFPWLKAKLELTIIAIQKAMKITRTVMSLHFLLCLIIPPIWVTPSLDGYLPIMHHKPPMFACLICLTFSKKFLFKIASHGEYIFTITILAPSAFHVPSK